MQEVPVAWDVISVYKHMSTEAAIFVLYLVVVLVFSVVRFLNLARRLWFFPGLRGISSRSVKADAADTLAASALANRLPPAAALSSGKAFPQNKRGNGEALLQIEEAARPMFSYLWELSALKVAAMKRLAILTLILSGLIESRELISFLTNIQIRNSSDYGDTAGGPGELPIPLVLGLAVSAVLYALSSWFSGVLARRRAEWNLFVAKVHQ